MSASGPVVTGARLAMRSRSGRLRIGSRLTAADLGLAIMAVAAAMASKNREHDGSQSQARRVAAIFAIIAVLQFWRTFCGEGDMAASPHFYSRNSASPPLAGAFKPRRPNSRR